MSNEAQQPPTNDEVRAMREALGLTQDQAGALVHVSGRTWRKWELAEREMHPAFFELFLIKTGATHDRQS